MTDTNSTPPPGPSAPPPPPTGDVAAIDLGGVISQSFELYKANFVPFFVGNLVMGLINGFAMGLLMGPYFKGMHTLVKKARNGETPMIGDVFKGFDNFGNTFVGGLIFSLCVGVGFAICFVPGIFVAAFLTYLVGLCAAGTPLGDAFNMSMEKAKSNLGGHLLFWVVIPLIIFAAALPGYAIMFVINFFLGLLVLYGAMFVAAPLLMICWTLVYDNQFGE